MKRSTKQYSLAIVIFCAGIWQIFTWLIWLLSKLFGLLI
jgi:hypothetical protein